MLWLEFKTASDCVLQKSWFLKLSLTFVFVDVEAIEKLWLFGIRSILRCLQRRFSASGSGDVELLRFLLSMLSDGNKLRLGKRLLCVIDSEDEVFVPSGLVNRARFDEALVNDSEMVTTGRLADLGVFFFPDVFFFSEGRFFGDFNFDDFE